MASQRVFSALSLGGSVPWALCMQRRECVEPGWTGCGAPANLSIGSKSGRQCLGGVYSRPTTFITGPGGAAGAAKHVQRHLWAPAVRMCFGQGKGLSVEKLTDPCQTKIKVIWDIKHEEFFFNQWDIFDEKF